MIGFNWSTTSSTHIIWYWFKRIFFNQLIYLLFLPDHLDLWFLEAICHLFWCWNDWKFLFNPYNPFIPALLFIPYNLLPIILQFMINNKYFDWHVSRCHPLSFKEKLYHKLVPQTIEAQPPRHNCIMRCWGTREDNH